VATWEEIKAAEPEKAADFLEVLDMALRPGTGQFAQVLSLMFQVKMLYLDTTSAFRQVLNALDVDAPIPNTGSGLAGAEDVTKELILAEITPYNQILLDNDTDADKLRRIKFAGINAG